MRACVGPCCGAPCPSIQHYTGGSVRWQDRWPMNHTCILLYRDWAHPRHIFTGTGLARSTSAPGLGSRLPYLHRDRVTLCHICTGTVLTPATSASGPGWRSFHFAMLSSGPAPLHRFALHKSATGNGSCRPSPDRSHPGLGSPPAHICTGTRLGCLAQVLQRAQASRQLRLKQLHARRARSMCDAGSLGIELLV
jgi:hypothetical protein